MNRTTISCVKWVDFSDHMFSTFLEVYANGLYTDVTLILSDGGRLTACRMILSMASKFFDDIFHTALTSIPSCIQSDRASDAPQDVYVMIPDVSSAIMKHVLHFIYTGEVHMNARDMSDFFEACQLLRLKGLNYHNGNINGVKIAGSNIITPEQYEYEELQGSYAEGSLVDSCGAVESEEIAVAEPAAGADMVNEVQFQMEEVHKDDSATESETVNQYYEMDINMVDFEPSTSNQEGNEPSTVVRKEELVSENQSDGETSGESSGLCKKRLKNVEYGNKLDEAINTIIQGGASFRTASIQYGIPKTVLWRKAVKAPNYKAERFELPSPRKEAIEALKAGEKLLNISKRFDIPLSTLHRDKIKLFSEGALPDNVMLKQRDKGIDFKDRVLEAAQQCVAGLMSQSEASKLYRLPKTTIWRKIRALREMDVSGGMQIISRNASADMSANVKPDMIEVLESHEEGGMESDGSLEPDYVTLV